MCVQPFSIWIDDQCCKILHVACFVVCTQTDFIKRVEGNGVGRACRLESQDAGVALGSSPAGCQFVNLAFEVGDKIGLRAMVLRSSIYRLFSIPEGDYPYYGCRCDKVGYTTC